MQCPHCHFVAAPGQSAVEGVCPNCERPYRDQPTPLNSEMEMRNMPEPGMEDSGGNPLQEGILGDYQNRGVRDEAFASVQGEEPEFEVTEVVLPDPDSVRPDKGQMDKQADFMDTLGDIGEVAAPIAGGVAGFALGGPAGAALGAGLAGGGMKALNGGDVGEAAGAGLTDAALGGLGGIGAGAMGLGAGAAEMGAADAAEQGATKGGIGSLMKSAWSKVPTEKIKNAYLMHSVLNDASNATQPMTAPAAPQQNMIGGPPPPSIYSAVETPTSHGEIPSNNTEDPEQVDFHEKNDGSKDGLQSELGINGIGGTDLGPDDFFAPDSGSIASVAELLPKILEFALSDKSAAGDPDMEELHQKLEAEKPGYMNSANDDHGEKLVLAIMKGAPSDDADDALQDNDEPHDPISEHEATALRPGLETTCPVCGSVMDASNGHCPQCGKENGWHQPQPTNPDFTTPQQMMDPPIEKSAAMTQGPNTDQQKAQVAELLQSEGRAEEIPSMIMEPWNYAAELAKITGQEEPPEQIGQDGPPPPIPPGGQQGEMPMPGMTTPEMGPQMMAAVKKYAATVDGFCEACPKCGSHSTGYLDYEEGKAGCKTCGNKWDAPKMVEHSAAGEDLSAAPIQPELSQPQPEVEPEQSSSLSWTDESGAPLKVGQTYDMYSNNYDIPDRITVTAVKPDVVEFTLQGEYGLSHRTELTHEEAAVEGDTFVPVDEEIEPTPEENQGAQPMDPPPGQQTDLSTPHELMTAHRQATHPEDGALPPCPYCHQDMLQFRHGVGLGPLYPDGAYDCANCHNVVTREEMAQMLTPDTLPPSWEEHQGRTIQQSADNPFGMGTAPPIRMNSHEIAMGEMQPEVSTFFNDAPAPEQHEASLAPEPQTGETGPSWLLEGVPMTSRMAGAQMTPWEQRGFIDEVGDARNADKLQLGGTHYEMDDLSDQFLFGDIGL